MTARILPLRASSARSTDPNPDIISIEPVEETAPDVDPASGRRSGIEFGLPRPAARMPDESFRALYEAEVDFVWRNLRRLGVREADLEDKTQEVFVVAHRRFSEFEDRGYGARAWLFQIALRIASDARRHRRRHPEDADGGASLERQAVDADQTGSIARREDMDSLDRALGTIDIDRRAVLVLFEIEEQTAPEIAAAMGISVNTVYSRLRVARAELEMALKRDALRRGGVK